MRRRAPVAAAKPDTRVGSWTLVELLQSQGGVRLYRARGPRGTRVLQEVHSPAESRPALLRAVALWSELELPQAVPIEEVIEHGSSVFLVNPEIESSRAPGEWPEQLAELVSHLLDCNHPLALEVMHEEYLQRDARGGLLVWNPGWATLRHPGMAAALQVRAGLLRFGALLEKLAGDRPDLLWIMCRCRSGYANFPELRQALRQCEVVREPLQEGDDVSPVRATVHSGKRWLACLAAGVVLLSAGVWAGRPAPKIGPGVAFVRDQEVDWRSLDGKATKKWKMEAPVTGMASSGARIVVTLRDRASVEILEVGKKAVHLDLPEHPVELTSTPDGRGVLALCASGRVARVELQGPTPRLSTVVFGHAGLTGAAPLEGEEDVVVLHPTLGLARLASKTVVQSCLRSGLDSVIGSGEALWASSSRERKLYQFDGELAQENSVALPGGAGTTRLYLNPYRRQLWSVHSGGAVGLWKLPETRLVHECKLASEAACVSADPVGRLWILSKSGELLSLDSQTWDLQSRATRLAPASAIAFVTPRLLP